MNNFIYVTNWHIKPFTMYAFASFLLFVIFKNVITPDLAKEYLAGAVLLGTAPCTAMVFVWSTLTTSPAALATTVGVLTEVPIMLLLIKVANSTRKWFPQPNG